MNRYESKDCLGQFIDRPVILASVDQNDFAGNASHTIPLAADEHDGKTIAALVARAAHDFKTSRLPGRKEFLDALRVLRAPHVIAQEHHARLQIARFPCVKKSVGDAERENISGIFYRRFRNHPARTCPGRSREQSQENKSKC